MKVYIVTDLEGVGGVVLPKQTGIEGLGEPMYQVARHLLTQEVNAAIGGAFEGGAREVVVLDGHGANSAYNMVLEDLDERAEYIFGTPWGRYLPGLDETYDAVFFVGFHSMAGTDKGVLDHTMSSASWVNAWLNGIKVGETGFCAALSGHFDVPVTLVTGDLAACEEAKALLGTEIEVAPVKVGLSRTSAKCMHPNKARQLIKERARAAMKKTDKVKPFKLESPVELKIEYLKTEHAQPYMHRKGAKLVDPRTVVFTGKDVLETFEIWLG